MPGVPTAVVLSIAPELLTLLECSEAHPARNINDAVNTASFCIILLLLCATALALEGASNRAKQVLPVGLRRNA